jgi:hypothetical protein
MYVESVVHFLSTEGAEFGLETSARWQPGRTGNASEDGPARPPAARALHSSGLPLTCRCRTIGAPADRTPAPPGSIPTGRAHRLPL